MIVRRPSSKEYGPPLVRRTTRLTGYRVVASLAVLSSPFGKVSTQLACDVWPQRRAGLPPQLTGGIMVRSLSATNREGGGS